MSPSLYVEKLEDVAVSIVICVFFLRTGLSDKRSFSFPVRSKCKQKNVYVAFLVQIQTFTLGLQNKIVQKVIHLMSKKYFVLHRAKMQTVSITLLCLWATRRTGLEDREEIWRKRRWSCTLELDSRHSLTSSSFVSYLFEWICWRNVMKTVVKSFFNVIESINHFMFNFSVKLLLRLICICQEKESISSS
jgi:hypothetical protein